MANKKIVIPQEDLINPYCPFVANKINFLMDLKKFKYLNITKFFGVSYKIVNKAIRSDEISKEELEKVITLIQEFKNKLGRLLTSSPQDTKEYRKKLRDFITLLPLQNCEDAKSINAKSHFVHVCRGYKELREVYLSLNTLFAENPF